MPEAGGTATPASFWKKLLRQSARIPLSRRRELLMNTPFLNFMTEREIDWLADAATVTSFRAGERLPDSPYYLIVIGTVELRRTRRGSDDLSDDAAARPGRVFGPGEFYIRRTAMGGAGATSVRIYSAACLRQPLHAFVRRLFSRDAGVVGDAGDNGGASCRGSRRGSNTLEQLDMRPLSDLVGRSDGTALTFTAARVAKLAAAAHSCSKALDSVTNLDTRLVQVPLLMHADLETYRELGEVCTFRVYPAGAALFTPKQEGREVLILLTGSASYCTETARET